MNFLFTPYETINNYISEVLYVIFGVIIYLLFMLLIILRIFKWIISLGAVAAIFLDIVVIGGFTVYYAHHEWFVKIASGKAVYFWDVVCFAIVGSIYTAFLMLAHQGFPKIAAIFHYIVAWVATFFVYLILNLILFDSFGKLLDHKQWNLFVHAIIISILAIYIFSKRRDIFKHLATK